MPGLRKVVALALAALMLMLPPLASVRQAHAEVPGVKKVVVGGAVAVGAIALLSKLFKPAASVATNAVVKKGVLGMLTGMFTKPWLLIPVTIGVGLVAYHLWQKYYSPGAYASSEYNRYNRTDGRRYENPAYTVPVFGNAYGAMNPYENGLMTAGNMGAGMYGGMQPVGFLDQLKMTVTGGAYVPPSMMAAAYGGSGGLNMGNNAAFALRSPPFVNGLGTAALAGPNGISGSAFDLPGIGDPARLGRTDVIGRGLTNGDETLLHNRSSLNQRPLEASSTLEEATATKNAAYTAMVDALKGSADGSFTGDVKKSIDAYRAAEERLKELQAAK
jgi:hypothetical protein